MPFYLSPGVYFEELSATAPTGDENADLPPGLRVRSPWTTEHTTVAFLGASRSGPWNIPVKVSSLADFLQKFDGEEVNSFFARAVGGFFANGGQSCYVVGVGPIDGDSQADDFIGDVESRTGLGALEQLHDVSIVALPDLMTHWVAGSLDLDGVRAVQLAAIAHCEMMGDRVVLLDTPCDLNARQVYGWRRDYAEYDSKYSAMYWPWVHAARSGESQFIPPSGHVAGVFARVDQQFGPHRAPLHETVRDADALEIAVLKAETDQLYPVGVNVLYGSPQGAILIWGARTLSTDPAWRWLPARRLMNFMKRNVVVGTEWAVGARPTDPQVWAQLMHDVSALLRLLWRGGALGGDRPSDAYTVRCDAETNAAQSEQPTLITLEGVVVLDTVGPVGFRVLWVCG